MLPGKYCSEQWTHQGAIMIYVPFAYCRMDNTVILFELGTLSRALAFDVDIRGEASDA